eukprot:gene12848-16065_t
MALNQDMDFFSMIAAASDDRMEDQRSTLPVIEKPMEYDFELEKVRQIGLESV